MAATSGCGNTQVRHLTSGTLPISAGEVPGLVPEPARPHGPDRQEPEPDAGITWMPLASSETETSAPVATRFL